MEPKKEQLKSYVVHALAKSSSELSVLCLKNGFQTTNTGWHTHNGAGKDEPSKFIKGVNKSSLYQKMFIDR